MTSKHFIGQSEKALRAPCNLNYSTQFTPHSYTQEVRRGSQGHHYS